MARSSAVKKPRKKRSISASKRRKLDTTPSEKQWLSWKLMQFCSVNDPRNNERVTFHLGESILILNDNWRPDRYYDSWDFWVGKIIAIRGNAPQNTWVKVQWYYSGKDIAEKDPTVDTSFYGRYERSLGCDTDTQLISVLSINGKAEVVEYNESSLDQEPVPSDVFYTRRRFDLQEGATLPITVDTSTCFCQELYNPDALDPMHLCLHCKRWYHTSCLAENGHTSVQPADQCTQELLDIPATCHSHIPWDLLQLACMPIIRGGPTHGVVGNVKAVSQAHEWAQLYAQTKWTGPTCPGPLWNGATLDQWLDSLEGVEVKELVYPGDEGLNDNFFMQKNSHDEEPPLHFKCPSCERLI